MSDRKSDSNDSKDLSTFTFSTPISRSVPDWKLILSSTDSDTSAVNTVRPTRCEVPLTPIELSDYEETKNGGYLEKVTKDYVASNEKGEKAYLSAAYNEASALFNSINSSEELLRSNEMNPLSIDNHSTNSTNANFETEFNFQFMLKSMCSKETYSAKPSENKFTENLGIESNSYFSNYSRDKENLEKGNSSYLSEESDGYLANNEANPVLAKPIDFTDSNEGHLVSSRPDYFSTKNRNDFSCGSNSQVADCSASLFKPLESSVESGEYRLSVERDNDSLEVDCDIYEDLPDILMSELPFVDEETCSSFPLNRNYLKSDTIQDASNLSTVEVMFDANDKEFLEDMEGLEFDGGEILEANPSIDNNSLNLNSSSTSEDDKDRFVLNNFGRNPFRPLSPITEQSCENSAHIIGETNNIKMVNVSSSCRSEHNQSSALEKISTMIGDRELPSCGAKNLFESLAEKRNQDVNKIKNSLMMEAEAYKSEIKSNLSRKLPTLTNSQKKHVSPIIIKLCSPDTANFGYDSTTENFTLTDIKTDVADVQRKNSQNLPTADLEIISIDDNNRLIQDEKMSISPDNRKTNTKNECSPMEISEASCSYEKKADSYCNFHEFNSLKELDNVNKTVANSVIKSMLELGNNKISIPQVLKYINQHKIMRVHSKLENEVRHFFKVVCKTGMLKKTKGHRYTLFDHKNNIPVKKSEVKPLNKKTKNIKLKSTAKVLRNSATQKISTRSHAKSIAITPKGAICRQLRNRAILVQH